MEHRGQLRRFRAPSPVMGGVPMFPVCAIAGSIGAIAVALAVAHQRGLPLLFVGIVAGCTVATQAMFSVGSAILTGEPARLVLYHRIGLFLLTVCGACYMTGQPVQRWLDAVTPALFIFIAAGRVGCWAAGCCYGRPSRFGAVYSALHDDAVAPAFIGVPLFPVQLAESVSALCIAAIGILGGPAGACFGTYAAARFVLEYFRGEPQRRLACGLTAAQWTSAFVLILVWPLAFVPLIVVAGLYRPIAPDHEVQLAQAISCCTRVERATATTSFGVSLTRHAGTLRITGPATPRLVRHISFLDRLVCATQNR